MNKMIDILKTFSVYFKKFRLKYHWSFFLGFQLTMSQQWVLQWFGVWKATGHNPPEPVLTKTSHTIWQHYARVLNEIKYVNMADLCQLGQLSTFRRNCIWNLKVLIQENAFGNKTLGRISTYLIAPHGNIRNEGNILSKIVWHMRNEYS